MTMEAESDFMVNGGWATSVPVGKRRERRGARGCLSTSAPIIYKRLRPVFVWCLVRRHLASYHSRPLPLFAFESFLAVLSVLCRPSSLSAANNALF